MSATLKDKIWKAIAATGAIRPADLDAAILEHKQTGKAVDKILIEKGLVKEQDILSLFVSELGVPFINLSKYKIDPGLQETINEKIARQYKIVPISAIGNSLTIAVCDPLNVFMIDDLKNITGRDIDMVISAESDVLKTLDAYYSVTGVASVAEISQDIQVEEFEIVEDKTQDGQGDENVDESEKAPIIRMVNLVIKEALKQRASDIHMEPTVDGMRVRYRIDGILRDVLMIPKENMGAVIVRIKILSRLDITMSQAPQDGRFKLKLGGREVDFRVSMLPTIFGQKIVMRILDKKNLSVGLSGLGLSEKAFTVLKEGVRKPFGMLLVTGPTGSGKSTTLYSIINELNTVDRNIITVEDPVEYLVEGLTQIQAQPEIGLTFAEGLRAILRQSPDVVMVGEIRDNETADIAIKASLTGQLVLSTLHTNDAAGALTRLVDMGVEPFLVASSLVIVTAQRLCRRICGRCKKEIAIPREVLDRLKYAFPANPVFYHGEGCEHCRKTGYQGRLAITEVLDVDDKVRELLLVGKSSDDIKEFARQERGMATLWEDAMAKCLAGQTTLEEVLRITSGD
ncbi:MAG: Flp pilus assembly complex ATPase component TadA [Candidatus Omnitrophica bacterium]|nr:Flp pilus assembly complex ATPase component TadA [Candidatus Omnitrophota bacterium]